ncbi:hypothetical protein CerSpe_040890 [Prunus speciosa]
MAKRSDFAQKLLDDLRVRKEKMAAPQSSNRSNSMAIDAYAYSKQTHRGRGDMRTNGTIGSRTGNPQNSYRGSGRTPIIQEASNQIVAYGRDRSSGQVGDLSMALAFALENGGKLGRTDSSSRSTMLGFLNQFGRGSIDFRKLERKGSVNSYWGSTNQFPNLSNIHIEEISRGAQKLNQILRACSNGINVDNFSIEIGKELMKGAMDLEESLRMLVNLQEASEYMVSSQRKNRITLLDEDDEDDEDNTVKPAEQMQLDLPRFSFDKSSRHAHKIQEVGRTGLKQKVTAALTYSTEGSSFNHEKQGKITSTSVSQRKSVSYNPGVKNQSIFSDQKESKPEKERIPNVIAKLMGLNELPENENLKHTAQKVSSSKPKRESWAIGQTIQETSKISGVRTKDIENLASTNRQKVVEGNKYPLLQNTSFVLQAEKGKIANNVSLEVVIHDGKPPWKDLEGPKPVKGPGKTTTKTDKQQKSPQIIRPDKPIGHNSFKAELMMQGKTGFKVLPSNQHKSQNNHEFQQPSTLWSSESPEEKRRGEVKEQQSAQQKLQSRKRGSETISKSISKGAVDLQKKQLHTDQARVNKKSVREAVAAVQSKGVPNGTYNGNLARRKSSAELNLSMKDFSPNDQGPEPAKENFGIPAVMEERPVNVAPLQKAKSRRVNKSEIPGRIDEVVTRKNGTLNNLTRPLKRQTSILQEVAHRSHEKLGGHNVAEKVKASRLKQAEPRIIKSNKSTSSIQPSALAQNIQKEAEQASTLYDFNELECRSLKEPQNLVPNDICQNSVLVVTDYQQDQAQLSFGDDECTTGPNTLNGTHEESLDISHPVQLEHQKTFNWRKQEPLAESENRLKQIVIKSQLFLNTAEALFKLDIPFGILHDSGRDCSQDEDSKLTLDCGYEVMKRKGRRQELSVHPNCVKISISFVQTQSLDDLVKQLHKDFEKLKLYGRNGKLECEAEEYVPKMLQSDMHNLEPDISCMWDMGWDETMFAILEVDEVIKDLERLVLSGLVDELTRDLFHA